MKIVFLDTEFTGEHVLTTLVSAGFVTLEGAELYLTFNDYDRDQVTDWLRKNVLCFIDEAESVNSHEAFQRISIFLEGYAQGEKLHFVSAGMMDVLLLFGLWHHEFPERKYFHFLHCLPDYLNHTEHFDINTFFFMMGLKAPVNREAYSGANLKDNKHHSLNDAKVVRSCFIKIMQDPSAECIFRRFLD